MTSIDRHYWNNGQEILNDLWECRKERDLWRSIADELAENVGLSTAASTAKERYMQAVRGVQVP